MDQYNICNKTSKPQVLKMSTSSNLKKKNTSELN